MKKTLLASLCVGALLALPGCCKKDKDKSCQSSMKKDDCKKKHMPCKADKCGDCHKRHKGRMCDEDKEKGKKMSYKFLELEAADDVLL